MRMRPLAVAGVMVKVGLKLVCFFVVINATFWTLGDADIVRLLCCYYTDKLLLSARRKMQDPIRENARRPFLVGTRNESHSWHARVIAAIVRHERKIMEQCARRDPSVRTIDS